jgi:hypothetical protein
MAGCQFQFRNVPSAAAEQFKGKKGAPNRKLLRYLSKSYGRRQTSVLGALRENLLLLLLYRTYMYYSFERYTFPLPFLPVCSRKWHMIERPVSKWYFLPTFVVRKIFVPIAIAANFCNQQRNGKRSSQKRRHLSSIVAQYATCWPGLTNCFGLICWSCG